MQSYYFLAKARRRERISHQFTERYKLFFFLSIAFGCKHADLGVTTHAHV